MAGEYSSEAENKIDPVIPVAAPVILNKEEYVKKKRKYWMLRRTQDILFSAIALLLLWPVFLIVAAAVWVDDPHGSPIFSQIRCGRDGKLFRMYKFRSMCVNAEERLEELLKNNEMDGPAFKMKDDPRITRVGRFIRRISLDELPQLVNILRGDMSIVGDRDIIGTTKKNVDFTQFLAA